MTSERSSRSSWRRRPRGRPSVLIAIILSSLCGITSEAATIAEVESTYLGSGVFQYRVKMFADAFFTNQVMTFAAAVDFPNRTSYGPVPANWEGATHDQSASWGYVDNTVPQPLPYEQTFVAYSSETHFKTVTNSFWIGWILWPRDWPNSPYTTVNVAAYAKLAALVPCPADQADGSATTLIDSVALTPDIHIDAITSDSITFSWPSELTVLLQSSADLITWTDITSIYGHAPSTTWTSPVPLATYGRYFRLQFIGYDEVTTRIPRISTDTLEPASPTTSVHSIRPAEDGLLDVVAHTEVGKTYRAMLVGADGEILQSRTCVAQDSTSTFRFSTPDTNKPLHVQVLEGEQGGVPQTRSLRRPP